MPTIGFYTNIDALIVGDSLAKVKRALTTNLTRLSSGLRINSAADDPAGMAMSVAFESQIRSIGAAQRNTNEGVSLAQTIEGGLDQIQSSLSRMRELAVESANGTLTSADRSALDTEFQSLKTEVDRMANTTTFNGQYTLNTAAQFSIQVGIDPVASENTITVSTTDVNVSSIGTATTTTLNGQDVLSAVAATAAISSLDVAIGQVASARAKIGAATNRLNSAVDFLGAKKEALSSANSVIRDADIAEETMAYTRNQILAQGGVALLAQANILPSIGLSLLQGIR